MQLRVDLNFGSSGIRRLDALPHSRGRMRWINSMKTSLLTWVMVLSSAKVGFESGLGGLCSLFFWVWRVTQAMNYRRNLYGVLEKGRFK